MLETNGHVCLFVCLRVRLGGRVVAKEGPLVALVLLSSSTLGKRLSRGLSQSPLDGVGCHLSSGKTPGLSERIGSAWCFPVPARAPSATPCPTSACHTWDGKLADMASYPIIVCLVNG